MARSSHVCGNRDALEHVAQGAQPIFVPSVCACGRRIGLYMLARRTMEGGMNNSPRVDAELAAFFRNVGQELANHPAIRMELPYGPHRRTLEAIALKATSGGPVMAETRIAGLLVVVGAFSAVSIGHGWMRHLPVMVHFHGGGFVQSSIDTHDRLSREYAAAGDIAVVSVDYSLSPEAKFPRALQECAAVVRHVAERGPEWNADGSRILLGGYSVGGNLAFTVALLLRETNGPPIKGLLASYPVCDSRLDTPS
jgi:acetyl esterase/lipase